MAIDKQFKDNEGNVYKLMGERILVNDNHVLKSWFGCATVKNTELNCGTLHVDFDFGALDINGVEEIKPTSIADYLFNNDKDPTFCSSDNPMCPKAKILENLKMENHS
jgi:hypothetical protein